MTGIYKLEGRKGRSLRSAPLLGLLCAALVGCGGLLDVENPNNIKGEDTRLPTAGASLANGALARVAHGIVGEALVYQVVTDEFAWKGSRDGFRELDQGKLSNAFNEFTDGFFGDLAQARWLADEAVKVLEAQQAANEILNVVDLARTYLYAAIAYVSIANMFDDWALSDRNVPAAPVGPDAMGGFYDTAIGYLNKALPIATGRDAGLALTITAMRARANFDRAIWDKVGKLPITTGLVNASSSYVTAAVTDAQAALAAVTSPTWNFQFQFSSATGSSAQGAWINSRQENRIGGTYVKLHATDPTWVDTTVLRDPIDNKPAPFVHAAQREFKAARLYPPYTVVSAREMHLILAEAALTGVAAAGTFQTNINNLRALDKYADGTSLTPWTPASPVTDLALLQHSRQSNLFLQTRRLSDHYRFGIASPEWLAGSQALTSPGGFLPISAIECLSNTFIGAAKCSS